MDFRLMGLVTLVVAMLSGNAAALTEAQAETLIAEVRSQGLVASPVKVRGPTEAEQDMGLAMKIENDFACTLIVVPPYGDSLVPAGRRGDPLVEEFTLLHELAHCEHAHLASLFRSRYASEEVSRAYHDYILLAPWTEAVALYKEMFADTYAAAMLLARHNHSHEALALIREFAHWRREKELATLPMARVHATTPALEALLDEHRLLATLAPDALRAHALETASDALLASIARHPFADQIALSKHGTVDSARYVGWMWRAAEELSGIRTFEHYQGVAARLAHPMQDLLAEMRAFVKRQPPPEATRAFIDELQVAVDGRLNARVEHASIAPERGR